MHNKKIDVPIWDSYVNGMTVCESTSKPELPFPIPTSDEMEQASVFWEEKNWEEEVEIVDMWLDITRHSQTQDILRGKIPPLSDNSAVEVWVYKIDDVDAPAGEELTVSNEYNGPLSEFKSQHFSAFEAFTSYFLMQNEHNGPTQIFKKMADHLLRARIKRARQILNAFGVWVVFDAYDIEYSTDIGSYIYVFVNPARGSETMNFFTGVQRAIIGVAASMNASVSDLKKYPNAYGLTSLFYSMLRNFCPASLYAGTVRKRVKHPLFIALEDIKIRGTKPFSI